MSEEFRGGSFEPIESEDYVAPLTQSYKEINEGMANYWDQEISNANYKAAFAGKNLESLASMSSTIAETLAKREERIKQERINKGMLWLKENPLDIISQEKFEAEIARLKAEGKEIDEFVARYEKSEDSNIWTSQSFRDLNAAEKYGAVVSWVEKKVQKYDPENNPELQNATSYEEYKAAEDKASIELYNELGDLNPALVYKHVIGPQKEKEEEAYSKWNAKREEEIKLERVRIAQNEMITCMNNGQVGCHTAYLDKRSPYVGKANANKELMATYLNLAKTGQLTSKMIQDIETKHDDNNIISTADGKTYAWNEFFAEDWIKIKDAAMAYESKNMENAQKSKNFNANLELDKTLAEIQGENFNASKGYNNDQMLVLQSVRTNMINNGVTGLPLQRINNIINYGSANKLHTDEMRIKALKEIETGVLTTERLHNEYPVSLHNDSELKAGAAKNDPSLALKKENHKSIEALIKGEITADGSGLSADENKVIGHFQRKYNNLVKLYDSQGVENPEDAAYLQIKGEIELAKKLDEDNIKGNETWFIEDDWVYNRPEESSQDVLTRFNEQLAEKLETIDKLVKKNGVQVLDTQQLFKPEILQEWESGKKIPTFAVKLADKLNEQGYRNEDGSLMTGYDIMKRQKKIANIEEVNEGKTEDDPTYVGAFKKLNPSMQKKCLDGTPNGTFIALSSTGTDNVDWLGDLGPELKLFSEENGYSFSFGAALLDITPKLDLVPDMSENIFDFLDPFETNEFNKSLFKWSGGTDLNALNECAFDWAKKEKKVENKEEKKIVNKEENKKVNEKELYISKINHLDPKQRNVPGN